ncbi:MAG: MBL fold metallo-hydrolase, partial [Planctomycetota bacterium]
GHTDGSVSYLIEVDGRRVVFCGDAICGPGQVWDVYSLQKGTQTTDYHGFLGARRELVEGLGRIKAAKPHVLVPSHGTILREPAKAIDALAERLETCYDRYVAISALRHYFPKLFADYADRPNHMPIRQGKPVPHGLRHIGTTWVLISKDKAAFVMDCGSPNVVQRLHKMLADGAIRSVEGLWVTHYHDDHVDAIPQFQKAFDCPCYADASVAQVITEPTAWRLPCISPARCRVDRVTKDGESWRWHEWTLTAHHLPGQTLYHGGLLAEAGERKLLFVGDSFTMAGIDDYCAHNRNPLGRGVGFDRCIALIERLKPTHLFNCHVDTPFDFTPDQCRRMRATLAARERLFGDLVPWDHANYGLDASWVRPHPYEQTAKPGDEVTLGVVVTNHSAQPRPARCRPVLPQAWSSGGRGSRRADDWSKATIAPKTEGTVPLTLRVPPSAEPGRWVVPIDVHYEPRHLPQFAEAIVVIE